MAIKQNSTPCLYFPRATERFDDSTQIPDCFTSATGIRACYDCRAAPHCPRISIVRRGFTPANAAVQSSELDSLPTMLPHTDRT